MISSGESDAEMPRIEELSGKRVWAEHYMGLVAAGLMFLICLSLIGSGIAVHLQNANNKLGPVPEAGIGTTLSLNFVVEIPDGVSRAEGSFRCPWPPENNRLCRTASPVEGYGIAFDTMKIHVDRHDTGRLRIGIAAPDPYDWFEKYGAYITGTIVKLVSVSELHKGVEIPLTLRLNSNRRDEAIFPKGVFGKGRIKLWIE